MKRLKIKLFALVIISVFSFASSASKENIDLQVLSETDIKSLQTRFIHSSTQVPEGILKRQTPWDCKLYGMNTRLQTLTQKAQYSFAGNHKITNSGNHLVKNYASNTNGIVGLNGPFQDVLRLTTNGQIMAELSVPNKVTDLTKTKKKVTSVVDKKRSVVSYALCI